MAEQKSHMPLSLEDDNEPAADLAVEGYDVNDLRDDGAGALDDWMSKLLMNKEFQMVPAQNLQAIFSRLTPQRFSAGEDVIEQGKVGEYYYIITAGRCVVTRELPKDRGKITLAELSVGDTFGEEALITNAKRQATITMLTDGAIMKLTKDDFNELLSEPIVEYVNEAAAEKIVADGGKWLDVDFDSTKGRIARAGEIQIPMYVLRLKLDQVPIEKHYIITSVNIKHSSAAAHILRQYGYNVSVLDLAATSSD